MVLGYFCIFALGFAFIFFEMDALQNLKYTYKEYLDLEETSESRHEYFYGEVFALAGTKRNL